MDKRDIWKYPNLEMKYMILCMEDIGGGHYTTEVGFTYHTNSGRKNQFEVFYDTEEDAIKAISKLGEENRDYTVIPVFAKIGAKS